MSDIQINVGLKAANVFCDIVKKEILKDMEYVLNNVQVPEDMKAAFENLKVCDVTQVIQAQASLNGYVNGLVTMLVSDAYKRSREMQLKEQDFNRFYM